MPLAELLLLFLMYVVVPAWLLAGLADWACHRAMRIEETSGVRETLLHLLQLGLVGVPLLAVLFLEVNALLLLAMAVCVVLHHAAAIWDVHYADATRRIPPVEQHVHAVLEMTPVFAFATVAMLRWPEVVALLQGGGSFVLEFKRTPLPAGYLAGVLVAVVLLGLVPYGEELWRTGRVSATRAGRAATGALRRA